MYSQYAVVAAMAASLIVGTLAEIVRVSRKALLTIFPAERALRAHLQVDNCSDGLRHVAVIGRCEGFQEYLAVALQPERRLRSAAMSG